MKKVVWLFCVLAVQQVTGQTLSEIQERNARATGYAIIAARNPGQSFSVLMIPWDGVNTLEYNAGNQINAGWHPQAAIKGNYFSQPFDGSDFSNYSTVVLSQSEFDLYKGTGTQWWIACSTLPPFSSVLNSKEGKLGVGLDNPKTLLHLHEEGNRPAKLHLTNVISGNAISDGLELSAIEDLGASLWNFESGYLRFGTSNSEQMRITPAGNVGIGVTNPLDKLSVNGNISAKKVVVRTTGWSDYVFDAGYRLAPLAEVERFIQKNKHLPDVPSASEVAENGVSVGDTQAVLLRKIEEITLHLIRLEKKNKSLQRQIDKMKQNKGRPGKPS